MEGKSHGEQSPWTRAGRGNASVRNNGLRRTLPYAVGIVAAVTAAAIALLSISIGPEESVATPAAEGARTARAAEAAPCAPADTPRLAADAGEEAAMAERRRRGLPEEASTNGFTAAQMRRWRAGRRPPPGYTNVASRTEAPPWFAVFGHPSENSIALYLSLEPGAPLVGEPEFGDAFRRDFLESCRTPTPATGEDSPKTLALKRAVSETKAELLAGMEAGEDVCDVMRETHREFRRMARAKAVVESLVRERVTAGADDVDLVVSAANRILEEQGIAPLRMTPVLRRALLRMAERARESGGRRDAPPSP